MGKARNTSILASAVDSEGVLSAAKGGTGTTTGGSGGPKITSIVVTDSGYTNLDDTAVDTAGGYIKIVGSGFASGCQVLVGTVAATSVTFVSSTQVRAQVPATAAGTYVVYLVNSDGGVAIRVNGVSFSATPTWTTASALAGAANTAISIQLVAAGASTFALASGSSLPGGVSLSSGGLLSGTVTGISSETTYNFTVVATDAELQDSPRAFAFTISVADAFFPYTTLLLSGNGTNLATNATFLDSGPSNFSITRAGNTTQGTFSPYGANWSNYFDGTGDYLSLTGSALGGGNFTIELWGYFTSFPNAQNSIYSNGNFDNAYNSCALYITSSGAVSLYNYLSATSNSTTNVTLNTWTHIAVTRSGNTITYYINGVASGTGSMPSGNITDTAVQVMRGFGGITNSPIGYISNLRTVVGTAVYTSNFTPPTTPLTAISGTSLLTCADNRFVDDSTNNFAITRNGEVSVQRFSPFNPTAAYSAATTGGSAYFDGNGDSLTANYTGDPTTDFTIEFWWYPITFAPSYQEIFTKGIGIQVFAAGGAMTAAFSVNGAPYYLNAGFGNATLNSWNHIAVVKNSTTYTGYVNGVGTVIGTSNSVPGTQSNPVSIGYYAPGPGYNTTGYISDARYVVNSAVYTSNFTPPTAPLTAIANTQLLLNFTNAGVIDSTMQNNIETVGDAKISTTQSKFGGSSLAFDGTGDYLNIPNSPNLSLSTGNYTIEGWFYTTDNTQTQTIVWLNGNTASYAGVRFGVSGSGGVQLYIGDNGTGPWYANSGNIGTVANNTWYHFAVSKSSTNVKVFLNGTQIGTTYTAPATAFAGTLNYVGALNYADQGSPVFRAMIGYIDDLRITKGLARYTSNFTPPVSEFTPR
jgi:hypothetical protein